jgi:hypothetical protein
MLPYAEKNVANIPESIRGAIGRYLGLLATMGGHWRAAQKHFDTALRMNDDMGARSWLALTRLDYARMLLARDAVGDRARAEELHTQVLETSRELGFKGARQAQPPILSAGSGLRRREPARRGSAAEKAGGPAAAAKSKEKAPPRPASRRARAGRARSAHRFIDSIAARIGAPCRACAHSGRAVRVCQASPVPILCRRFKRSGQWAYRRRRRDSRSAPGSSMSTRLPPLPACVEAVALASVRAA